MPYRFSCAFATLSIDGADIYMPVGRPRLVEFGSHKIREGVP